MWYDPRGALLCVTGADGATGATQNLGDLWDTCRKEDATRAQTLGASWWDSLHPLHSGLFKTKFLHSSSISSISLHRESQIGRMVGCEMTASSVGQCNIAPKDLAPKNGCTAREKMKKVDRPTVGIRPALGAQQK
ncbi:hypothetical protein NDU88_004775 [Pleurodeles waltl]|uniref:Uncharacterized protein n=1 Tax=Pleurodeles waltl TaxID=8319 RepID=A0AAV7SJR3_PLEWA|nr:hypothetical protein NDU88_004775 [Pleurodeles waltl]